MKTRLFLVTYHHEARPGETLSRRMLAKNEADVVQLLGNDDSFDDCITIDIKVVR